MAGGALGYPQLLVVVLLAGPATVFFDVAYQSVLPALVGRTHLCQSVCPDRLLGRMNASVRFLVWGTIPLGGLCGGALGELVGPRAALLIAAVGTVLASAWLLASPLRRLRDLPADGSTGALSAVRPTRRGRARRARPARPGRAASSRRAPR